MSQTERYDANQRPVQGRELNANDRRQHGHGRDDRARHSGAYRVGSRSGGPSVRPAHAGRPRRGVKATLGWCMYEWGAHDTRFGVTIVAGCAALGAIGTVLTGAAPGGLLGFFVVLGTVTACMAVRPRASYLFIPSPALAYLVAAMFAGVIDDRVGGAAKATFAIGALQWIAGGFVAMVIATLCAICIAGTRWWLAIQRERQTATGGRGTPSPRSTDAR